MISRENVTARPARFAAAATLAALALTGAVACSAPDQDPALPPAAAPAAPAAPAPAAVSDATRQLFGQAGQGALALVALGGLGTDKGVGTQVQGLAPELTSNGQALLDQVRQLASAAGVSLGDQLDARSQALVADLGARSGQPFDTAWLQAAQAAVQQAKDAANAVLADPSATAEAKASARDTLAALDALAGRLTSAAGAAGARTPTAVPAGTGGQAADSDAALPFALGGAGVVLVGAAAALRLRRARA